LYDIYSLNHSTLLPRNITRHLFVAYISITYESIQYQKYSPKFDLRKIEIWSFTRSSSVKTRL